MTEHPETSNVRDSYAEYLALGPGQVDFREAQDEFNQWLSEVQATAFAEGKAEGLAVSEKCPNKG